MGNRACANLRPLFNSNVAKVSLVKWSHILITTARSTVSGFAIYFENALKMQIIGNVGYAINGTSCSGNRNLRTLYNRYFCTLLF